MHSTELRAKHEHMLRGTKREAVMAIMLRSVSSLVVGYDSVRLAMR